MQQQDIKSKTMAQLADWMKEQGQPGYRAKQVFTWLHRDRATDFAQMSNIPKPLLARMREQFVIRRPELAAKQVSAIDGTVKYLFSFADGECVETVWMRYRHGNSLCISTQAGCRMGCRFCASTIAGFTRNLTPAEMLDQVYEAERENGEKVQSLVLMGIGEPLDNYENVLAFLDILSDENGKNLSLRHVSLSTCGLVPAIDALSENKLGLTLSVSLHAATDERRSRIMPVNRKYPVGELMGACRRYVDKTGRRISFEYALIGGENDSERDAEQLAALLKGMLCHVNLILVNEVKETGYTHTGREKTQRFMRVLEQRGIPVTVRRRLGTDIDAACGQLRKDRLAYARTAD